MEALEGLLLGLSALALLAGVAASIFLARGSERWAWVSTCAVGISLVALVGGLVERGLWGGYWPLASPYEFALVCVGTLLLAYLAMIGQSGSRTVRAALLLLTLMVMGYARLGIPAVAQMVRPLPPALDSLWLQLHAGTLAMAYGAFGAAAVTGLLYLMRGWLSKWTALPSSEALEELGQWGVTLGFPWMTLAMITGAIWAQMAWGTYWNWEPKEILALATWLIYLLYLHARAVRGWRGRPLAILAILGVVLAVVNYFWAGSLARSAGLEVLRVY